ncbi:MAG TPA: PQQ-binding-like beta-propeller repeat protein [Gemmatimonadales bacterium]|jgi:outer membrane protein assembly factor BamB|nr:PQQ-binding-like beta-propeller repeat protein [Gemmatimonadales bacterium]
MASMPADLLYAGVRGHVVALDKGTGKERWRTKLKGAEFVHLVSDARLLYASTRGNVFALDPATGAILWQNPMKGLGFGLTGLVAGPGGQSDALLDMAQRRARARQAG